MKGIIPLVTILTFTACSRDNIEVRQVPKEEAPSLLMPSGVTEPHSHASGLRWTLPMGWKELPGGGMRLATLVPPQEAGKSEVSIVVLSGDSGGELANVNRWRGQVGLPPIDEDRLPETRKTANSRAGVVMVYDFTGDGTQKSRLITGAIKVDADTWFFKLTGEEKAVAKNKAAFIKLLEGLKNDAS